MLEWEPSLEQMKQNVEDAKSLILRGLQNRGEYWAVELEAEAKKTAPWTDRTGQARQGLTGRNSFATYTGTTFTMTISLFHTKEYGPFLELGTINMSPYPVILPVMQRNYKNILKSFEVIFGG